jgi:hypothetical protein
VLKFIFLLFPLPLLGGPGRSTPLRAASGAHSSLLREEIAADTFIDTIHAEL